MPVFETKIFSQSIEDIEYVAKLLLDGEIIGLPTETVYGLAGNALDEESIKKIFKAKGRPQDNPLIVHVSSVKMMRGLVKEIPEIAEKLAEAFWPGPLTMVLEKNDKIPNLTSGGLSTVGIRMPNHKIALEVISRANIPLAAPSANISGKPSPTSAKHVLDDMKGKIPAIIDGGECDGGVESTVISFEGDSIYILRPGLITRDMLLEFTENVFIDNSATSEVASGETVKSPGMKYKHYSPEADVYILDGKDEDIIDFANKMNNVNTRFAVSKSLKTAIGENFIDFGDSPEEQASRLFKILRDADISGVKSIYFQVPEQSGKGLAVLNRLLRAAEFKVIKL